jgi:cytochrome P450
MERRRNGGKSEDVLGVMLSARRLDGTAMNDDEIRDELLTMLTAGHETTAVGLSWALYELARHPAALQRLREELDTLGFDPSPDVLTKSSYLGAVCKEALRLHTILTEIARTLRVPCHLVGFQLPAGTSVAIGIGAIHQDPSLYPEPQKFRPERFLARDYGAFEYLPFGGGHRRCLGATLAEAEMRIVLATIVTSWDFTASRVDEDARHNIGSGPKHGVRLRITRRDQAAMSLMPTV